MSGNILKLPKDRRASPAGDATDQRLRELVTYCANCATPPPRTRPILVATNGAQLLLTKPVYRTRHKMNQSEIISHARQTAATKARSWARTLRLDNTIAKLVLFIMAQYVDDNGVCVIGAKTLAEHAEISSKTACRRLKWLEDIGAIVRAPLSGPLLTYKIRLKFEADIDQIEICARSKSWK